MSTLQLKYNSKYAGQYYKMVNGYEYSWRTDGKFVYAGAQTGGIVQVQLTGYYSVYGTINMYQTINNKYIDIAEGWEYAASAPIRHYTPKDAQFYLDKIIKANKKILQNNLFCARFANKLNEDQQWDLYFLQKRMAERNEKLISDGFCSEQKISSPPGYSMLSNSLSNFMVSMQTGAPIGAVVSISTIVIAAVIIASLSTAAYFAYKYIASEAEKDVKFSDDLTRTLVAKLTKEEFEQLMEETNGIVTRQKILSSIGGGLGFVKFGLLAVAGLAIYKTFKDYKKGKQS